MQNRLHVVIGGYGRVGRYLARMLEFEGHSVSVIDQDPLVFEDGGAGPRWKIYNGTARAAPAPPDAPRSSPPVRGQRRAGSRPAPWTRTTAGGHRPLALQPS